MGSERAFCKKVRGSEVLSCPEKMQAGSGPFLIFTGGKCSALKLLDRLIKEEEHFHGFYDQLSGLHPHFAGGRHRGGVPVGNPVPQKGGGGRAWQIGRASCRERV